MLGGLPLFAQESNVHERYISTQTDTVVLDSLSIAPASFSIDIDSSYYTFNPASSVLIWKKRPNSDSLKVSYRTLAFNFTQVVQNKDTTILQPDYTTLKNPFRYTVTPQDNGRYSFNELQKQGSISRGLSFGNSQNLSVNSNLNLQLSGKITDRVSILAAISDNNIPVQPEGNTQQIQDFDQVYIQLFDDNNKLTAGDFQIQKPKGYFLQFNKRLRGGSFESHFKLNKENPESAKMDVQVSASLSRGKFARNIIQGVEGSQGPYQLTGTDDESYIIVLSGTERVYINGELLTRGQDYDYVIDYNLAEITFTANQLITKDKRIIVEFQYTAQSYSRSLIQSGVHVEKKKWTLNFNAYSEQDAKNQPLQQDLTDEQIELLSNVGDNTDAAIASSVEQVDYEDDRVLYKLVTDTLSNGNIDSIFVYSTNPDSAIYQLSFTNVGASNGNYIQVESSANGQVYEYVAPIGGIPQGSYEPVIVLVTPKLTQLFTLGGTYQVNKNTLISYEGALSNNDLNTFSDKDGGDNVGYGLKVTLNSKKALSNKANPWYVTGEVDYEQISQDFDAIERFRSVEFDRNWNIRDLTLTKAQYIPTLKVGLQEAKSGQATYGFQGFLAGSEYNAYRHLLNTDLNFKKYLIEYNASLMESSGDLTQSEFFRHQTLIKRRFKYFNIGYRDDLENNILRIPESDSLSADAYRFWEIEFFVETPDSSVNKYRVLYNQRWDYGSIDNEIRTATRAEGASIEFELNKNPNSRLKGKGSYRQLKVLNSELYTEDPENTVLGRLEYTLRMLKGSVSSTSFYEVSSGLEERQGYVYVEVSAGQGVYTWTDYNENGVKELDEFEVAVFQDQANYLRVATQTNNFIRTFSNQFNQTFFFRPSLLWSNASGLKKFIGKFSDQVTYLIDRKTNRELEWERFNPFTSAIKDTSLISTNSSLRNTIYFNRTHPKFSIEHTYQQLSTKNLLTNGSQAQSQRYQKMNIRYNFTRQYQINLEGEQGEKSTISEYFTSRNWDVDYYSIAPKFTYQPSPQYNISAQYSISQKENSPDLGSETAVIQKGTLEGKLSKIGQFSIIATVSYVEIEYDGTSGTSLAYELLEGLQTGKNGTWEVMLQKNLGQFLQLSINYNGRISEETDAIHAGSVQVRAYF